MKIVDGLDSMDDALADPGPESWEAISAYLDKEPEERYVILGLQNAIKGLVYWASSDRAFEASRINAFLKGAGGYWHSLVDKLPPSFVLARSLDVSDHDAFDLVDLSKILELTERARYRRFPQIIPMTIFEPPISTLKARNSGRNDRDLQILIDEICFSGLSELDLGNDAENDNIRNLFSAAVVHDLLMVDDLELVSLDLSRAVSDPLKTAILVDTLEDRPMSSLALIDLEFKGDVLRGLSGCGGADELYSLVLSGVRYDASNSGHFNGINGRLGGLLYDGSNLSRLQLLKLANTGLNERDAETLASNGHLLRELKVLDVSQNPWDRSALNKLIPLLKVLPNLEFFSSIFSHNGFYVDQAIEILQILPNARVEMSVYVDNQREVTRLKSHIENMHNGSVRLRSVENRFNYLFRESKQIELEDTYRKGVYN